MAVSKCVYPYPVLIIRDAATVEWVETKHRHIDDDYKAAHQPWLSGTEIGEQVPVVRDVRLSFYQLEGKPWDWSRARRLADACYASHGAISIEDPMGNVWLDGEQPPEFSLRAVKAPTSKALQAAIRDFLAGAIDTATLARLAA